MQKASRLKLARLAEGMNQAELAKKIGKSQMMISHFESGRLRVGAGDRKKLAGILKTSEKVFELLSLEALDNEKLRIKHREAPHPQTGSLPNDSDHQGRGQETSNRSFTNPQFSKKHFDSIAENPSRSYFLSQNSYS